MSKLRPSSTSSNSVFLKWEKILTHWKPRTILWLKMSCQILNLATGKIKGCLSEPKCHFHHHFPEINNGNGYLWKPLMEMTILAPTWQLSNYFSDPVIGNSILNPQFTHASLNVNFQPQYLNGEEILSYPGSLRQPVTDKVFEATQRISEEQSQPFLWKWLTQSQNTRL